jgi:hypothetical protein
MEPVSVSVPDRGDVRTYTAPVAARALGVTAKTVVSWVATGCLAGWPPRSTVNPSRSWVVDAAAVDRRVEATSSPASPPVTAPTVESPWQVERQLLDLERSVFESSRLTQLEEDNARLRAERDRLAGQVAALGRLVHELTDVG